MRYLVFIKSEYVRDSQAFSGKDIPKGFLDGIHFTIEAEDGWRDIEGDVLVADMNCETEEELSKRIRNIYPEASIEIFRILKLSDAEQIKLT